MIWIPIILAVLALLLLRAPCGRRNHPNFRRLTGWKYAHRGLHAEGIPENSMAAFRRALEHGYGIELDVHLMKDGKLAVIHDSSLERVAGACVKIEDLTEEDLVNYPLQDTRETIPLFSQVLELYAGKAPLIIELKPAGGNTAALTDAAVKLMEGYEGPWCMESFDPRCVFHLRRKHPQVIRGQLSYHYLAAGAKLPWIFKLLLTYNLLNFLTLPDFVAYEFSGRKNWGNTLCRKLWRIPGVSWTLKTREQYDAAMAEGWLPIFESFTP